VTSTTNSKKVWLFEDYTEVYQRIKKFGAPVNEENEGIEIVSLQGGTESSKTYSAMKLICKICIKPPRPLRRPTQRVTVFGEDMPNLKAGALHDFKDLIKESPLLRYSLKNPESLYGPYYFHGPGKTMLEFKSFEDGQDAQSGKRDWAYAYECKGITKEIFEEIESRTDHVTFACFNPTAEFWIHEDYHNLDRVHVDVSTFRDNRFASDKSIRKIMNYYEQWQRTGKDYWLNKWRVHGLGQCGVVEGVIFQVVNWIDRLPNNLKYHGYGLDFGYNNPTALCEMGVKRGSVFGDEILYERYLTDNKIVKRFDEIGVSKKLPIFADNADPKAIKVIKDAGYRIFPVVNKNVQDQIDILLEPDLNITRESESWKKERDRYKWKVMRGKTLDVPIKDYDHLWNAAGYWGIMALDPRRRNSGKTSKSKRQMQRI